MNKTIFDYSFHKVNGGIFLLPSVYVWFNRFLFLETGVLTPGFGIKLSFLKWTLSFQFQKGY